MNSAIMDKHKVSELLTSYGIVEVYSEKNDISGSLYMLTSMSTDTVKLTLELLPLLSSTKQCYFCKKSRSPLFYGRYLIWRKGVWNV